MRDKKSNLSVISLAGQLSSIKISSQSPTFRIYALVVLLGQARIQAASSHKRRNAMTSLIMNNHNH